MPNRMLREGIITSKPVNGLSWPAEVLYRRLISVVDDFGRYFAEPPLIRAACYPLQLNKVSDSDITKWLGETRKAGLVRIYSVDDTEYLELAKFGQRVRALKSKFPHPLTDDGQVPDKCPSSAPVVGGVVVDENGGDVAPSGQPPDASASPPVIGIPLNDGSEYPITEPMVKEWEGLYPAVDVLQTLREVRGWNLANQPKRKTRSGVLKHVNTWLAREQNKGA